MAIPKRLETQGTLDEDKAKTQQYVLDTTIDKQTEIALTRHDPCYKHWGTWGLIFKYFKNKDIVYLEVDVFLSRFLRVIELDPENRNT